MNQNLYISLIFYLIWTTQLFGFSEKSIDINGSISQTYIHSFKNNWEPVINSTDGSFDFAEILLGFSADLTDKLRAGAQLISRDFGREDNFKTSLDWGYGDYQFNDQFGIRAGKVKYPLGFYNDSRDVDAASYSILLSQAGYPENFRNFANAMQGLSFYGTLEKPKQNWGSLEYQLSYGNINFPDYFILTENLRLFSPGTELDARHLGSIVLYWNTPLEGLRLGYTYSDLNAEAYMSNPFSSAGLGQKNYNYSLDVKTVIFGAEYIYKKWTFGGEAGHQLLSSKLDNNIENLYQNQYNANQAILTSGSQLDNDQLYANAYLEGILRLNSLTNLDKHFFYFFTNYQWTEKWNTQIMYSENTPKDKSNDLANSTKDITISTRYDFNEYWIGKLEYHSIKGTDIALPENPGGTISDRWGMFLARVSFSF